MLNRWKMVLGSFVVVSAVALGGVTPALACKCARVTPFVTVASQVPVVAHVKALKLEGKDQDKVMVFEVLTVLKGELKAKTLRMREGSTSCDVFLRGYEIGHEYVFTMGKTEEKSPLIGSFGGCSEDYAMVEDGKVRVEKGGQDQAVDLKELAEMIKTKADKP